MELSFDKRHVRRRMRLRGITREMVQSVADSPDTFTAGRYADLHDRMVDGYLLRVVVVPGTEPAIVKTVM